MNIHPLPQDDPRLQEWLASFGSSAQAELCVRYALLFNTLEPIWLDGALSPNVTYGSQSILETMQGYIRVWHYLTRKVEILRENPDTQPRCELATFAQGGPCVALFQPQSAYHCHWLEQPMALEVIKANKMGLASEFFMITAVPPPDSARRSGIYPGVIGQVHGGPKKVVRPENGYNDLCFTFYLLDGEINMDHTIMMESEKVMEAFPGAERKVVISMAANAEEREEIFSLGFKGFPSVCVTWERNVVFRWEGLISAVFFIRAVRGLMGE